MAGANNLRNVVENANIMTELLRGRITPASVRNHRAARLLILRLMSAMDQGGSLSVAYKLLYMQACWKYILTYLT